MEHTFALSGEAAYWVATAIFATSLLLIVTEKVHKTKVALLGAGATLLLGLLTQEEAFRSPELGIDYNVIFLLIGMMIIVNVLGKSGAFEWTAVKLAKVGGGRPFPIMAIFLVATAVFSALLDNVTTVLLFAPVTLLIADELGLDPVPFLVGEALASNIGGTATLIGDPPNLMIASRARLTFTDFVVHLAPIIAVMLVVFVALAWLVYGRRLTVDEEKRRHVLGMDERRLVKDKSLVAKSVFVLALTIAGFVAHGWLGYEPATVALIGAALLLAVSRLDPHEILAEIEWPTLFFFIGLYVIIGGIVKVGLVSDLSQLVIRLTQPSETSMLATSISILWFSGILSAFVDNIPYVATMAPLVAEMGGDVLGNGGPIGVEVLHHPVLMPVWWSLALGACLGGNGTPIGASANLVVLGIAERSGTKISFLRFMAFGLPVMVLTLAIASVYVYLRYYYLVP